MQLPFLWNVSTCRVMVRLYTSLSRWKPERRVLHSTKFVSSPAENRPLSLLWQTGDDIYIPENSSPLPTRMIPCSTQQPWVRSVANLTSVTMPVARYVTFTSTANLSRPLVLTGHHIMPTDLYCSLPVSKPVARKPDATRQLHQTGP